MLANGSPLLATVSRNVVRLNWGKLPAGGVACVKQGKPVVAPVVCVKV